MLGLLSGSLVAGCTVATEAPAPPPPPGPLVQWCIASGNVVTRAGAVSVWQDLSGQGNHLTQAIAGSRPTLTAAGTGGRPAISFDGIGQFLDNPYLGEPRCEIIVARLRGTRAGGPVFRDLPVFHELPVFHDLIGADGPAGVQLGAYYFQAMAAMSDLDRRLAYVRPTVDETVSPANQRDFAIRARSQPVIGAWGIFAVRNNGNTVRLYKSGLPCGQPVQLGSTPLQSILRATVGCGFYGNRPANFAPIDIAEKISFGADLSDIDFAGMVDTLRQRYDLGLSGSSGDFIWPVFQADGVGERGINDNLVLLQGDGETFRYRPSHYIPPDGFCVRDPSMATWDRASLLVHTLRGGGSSPTAFALAVSRDGLASFSHLATVRVGEAVADAPEGECWAPEFVRNRDNSTYLLEGRPVVLCNISPTSPAADNAAAGMQYYLFTPSGEDLVRPWTLLGRLEGLPPNIIDGFLLFDPAESAWFVSVTPCNPPQHTQLYRSERMLGGYVAMGTGDDPHGFGSPREGASILNLGGTAERYFLDARGTGYFISDNPGLLADGWSMPRPVVAPFMPQHGTPLPTPPGICTV